MQLIIKDLKHSEASHWYLEVQNTLIASDRPCGLWTFFLLYLPAQIRFLIGGECITCHGSKLTNSLGKQQLEHDQVVLLETAANLWASRCKANDFFAVYSSFELGGTCLTKHLMTQVLWETVSVLSPPPQCFLQLRLGKHWGSQGNKTGASHYVFIVS